MSFIRRHRETQHPTVAELEEAIRHVAATAARLPVFDYLSRPNPAHTRLHEEIDHLLDDRRAAILGRNDARVG